MQPTLFGMAAEFDDANDLITAARAARHAGYRRFEAYSPYPVKLLNEFIPHWDYISPMAFFAAIAGGWFGFWMQFFIAAKVYPTNIGGRPLDSWPAFIVIAFALIVLFALFAVFFGALFFDGLPSIYHPLFRVPSFRRASSDGFFLCIEARDGHFDLAGTSHFLHSLDPLKVWEVLDD